jgi:hypothetical protein
MAPCDSFKYEPPGKGRERREECIPLNNFLEIYLSLRHKIDYNISDFIKYPYSDLLLTSIQARE